MHAFMVRHQTPVLQSHHSLPPWRASREIGGLDNLQFLDRNAHTRFGRCGSLRVHRKSGVISFGHIGFMWSRKLYAAGWATAEPGFKQVMLQGLPDFLAQNQWPFPVAMVGAYCASAAIVALLFGSAILPTASRPPLRPSRSSSSSTAMISNRRFSNRRGFVPGRHSDRGRPLVAFAFALPGHRQRLPVPDLPLWLDAAGDARGHCRGQGLRRAQRPNAAYRLRIERRAGWSWRRPLRAVRHSDRGHFLPSLF